MIAVTWKPYTTNWTKHHLTRAKAPFSGKAKTLCGHRIPIPNNGAHLGTEIQVRTMADFIKLDACGQCVLKVRLK